METFIQARSASDGMMCARPGGPGKHQPTEVGQGKVGRMPSLAVKPVHGQPLTDDADSIQAQSASDGMGPRLAPGPEGRVRTSRRTSAKRKWQEAMFRVKVAAEEPVGGTRRSR